MGVAGKATENNERPYERVQAGNCFIAEKRVRDNRAHGIIVRCSPFHRWSKSRCFLFRGIPDLLVHSGLANPDKDLLSRSMDFTHHTNLVVLLLGVGLVDA